MAKCRVCGKNIDSKTSYKIENRKYACSESEWIEAKKNDTLFADGRRLILSLFNTDVTKGNMIVMSKRFKSIVEDEGYVFFNRLAKLTYSIIDNSKKFNEIPQNSKVKYMLAVMNNHYETMKSDFSKRDYVIVEDVDFKSNNKKESKCDISHLI